MRIFLVLICSLALACVALGEEQGTKKEEKPKKKGAQAGQVSEPTGKAAGKPTGAGKRAEVGKPTGAGKPEKVGKATGVGKPAEVGKATGAGKPVGAGKATGAGKPAEVGKATGAGKAVAASGAAGTKVKPQHFNLANKPKPEVQGWWRQRYNRIVVIGGGAYYWNAGYWYPAWGYDQANSYYPYDGPIYGYNDLPPDQVIANVQSALQQQGYYHGEVDGLLGPLTRAAVADYQRANGLVETAAIDQPTLESLGMS